MSFISYYALITTLLCLILLFRISYQKNKLKKRKNAHILLESELEKEKQEKIALENILEKKKNAKEAFYKQQQDKQEVYDAIEDALNNSPASFYTLKESCMNPNESLMFYYINAALNELITNPEERKLYYVFPQICLYSFVNTSSNLTGPLLSTAKNKYIRKSVDYLICKDSKKKYPPNWSPSHPEYCYHAYKPILAIELDGLSHSSPKYGEEAFKRQQVNDKFKTDLFDGLKIPLIRHQLEYAYVKPSVDGSKIKEEIAEKFKTLLLP